MSDGPPLWLSCLFINRMKRATIYELTKNFKNRLLPSRSGESGHEEQEELLEWDVTMKMSNLNIKLSFL